MKKITKVVISSQLAFALVIGNWVTPAITKAAELDMNIEEYELIEDKLIDVKQQEPVEITSFQSVDVNADEANRLDGGINLDGAEYDDFLEEELENNTENVSTVVAGSISDYLLETGDAKIYNIDLPAGVYVQAQLTTPANLSLDYDLYFLNSEGEILAGSEYYTRINGTSGTLPEALGYYTLSAETYYFYVNSSVGGSVTEAFTLDYSLSTAWDNYEIDEFASQALPFTFDIDGAYIDSRNLSSPIDNDWYYFNVTTPRIYDKIDLSLSSESANGAKMEVYRNVQTTSNAYEMLLLASGTQINNLSLEDGTYYVRICNVLSMEDFDETDMGNYTFTIVPQLKPTEIIVSEYNGNEGVNRMVSYPFYNRSYFRTSGWIETKGQVVSQDPITNEYYAVSNYSVTCRYKNEYWEANNTSAYATAVGTGVTNDEGIFDITMSLPPAMGVTTYNVGLTTQYFDLCDFDTFVTTYPNVINRDKIINYKYSLYN